MNSLDKHYTESIFSELLVNKIDTSAPERILDLGIGNGSLTEAAYKRWTNAVYWGFDIDLNQIENIKSVLPFVTILQLDGLSLENAFPFKLGSIDVAICNPPYYRVSDKNKYRQLFNSANLSNVDTLPYITADLIFLAKSLVSLKSGGQLGIILPNGLLTNKAFKAFRKSLIQNYYVKSVVELPANIFKKTEAKTHILVIEKTLNKSNYLVEVARSNEKGVINSKIIVNSDILYVRMDFTYNYWKLSDKKNYVSLKEKEATIVRSSKSTKVLDLMGVTYLHSTSYKHGDILTFQNIHSLIPKLIYAKEGDIVITRVGKRSIGKTCLIKFGSIPISDCLFIIRIQEEYRYSVFNRLMSNYGKEWINSVSHGVCSLVMSKEDLYSFTF